MVLLPSGPWQAAQVADLALPAVASPAAKAAVASLGACEWSALAQGLSPADAEKVFVGRRAALEGGLLKQEAEHADAFDGWTWNNREAGTGFLPGYADDFEQFSQNSEQWIFGGGRW